MQQQNTTIGEVEKPAYWAVLPATVRYDTALSPAARLLYAEISALSNKEGYCKAGNQYFATLYGVSKKTIEAWIKQLKDCGYITVEVIRDADKVVVQRRIWSTIPTGSAGDTPPLENATTSPRNIGEPPLEIEGKNNTRYNNIPPISPKGELGEVKPKRRRKSAEPTNAESTVFADYAGADTELLNTLLAFELDRKGRRKEMSENAKRMLCKRLDKLADTAAAKLELLECSILRGWDTVYPPHDETQPAKPAGAPARRGGIREL